MTADRHLTLAECPLGQKVVVSRVHTHDRRRLQKLIAMGVLPKTEIVLLQKFPSFVFQIQNTRFCIDWEIASSIFLQALE